MEARAQSPRREMTPKPSSLGIPKDSKHGSACSACPLLDLGEVESEGETCLDPDKTMIRAKWLSNETYAKPSLIVLICGRRYCGKNFVADLLKLELGLQLNIRSAVSRISVPFEKDLADRGLLSFDRLSGDRSYKGSHRQAMHLYSEQRRASDPNFDAKQFVQVIDIGCAALGGGNGGFIQIVTGLRDKDLSWTEKVSGVPVFTLLVRATMEAKLRRGWKPELVDGDSSELGMDAILDGRAWDFILDNDVEYDREESASLDSSTAAMGSMSLKMTIRNRIVPEIRQCLAGFGKSTPAVRKLRSLIHSSPSTYLSEGKELTYSFHDVLGLARHRGGLSLISKMIVSRLPIGVDVILGPELGGLIFGAAASSYSPDTPFEPIFKKPRSGIPTSDFVTSDPYSGSNIGGIGEIGASSRSKAPLQLWLNKEMITREATWKTAVIVDDVLASGRTAAAAINVARKADLQVLSFICVAEFQDLGGRSLIQALGVPEVVSFILFDGI